MRNPDENILQSVSPADRTRVGRNLKLGRGKEASSFYRKIEELTKKDGLLPETKIDVERVESGGGCGEDEMVIVEFRLLHAVTEITDKTSGQIEVTSAGPRFSYTFTARRSLEENMKEFYEFFERRSAMVSRIPTATKGKQVPLKPQARKGASR